MTVDVVVDLRWREIRGLLVVVAGRSGGRIELQGRGPRVLDPGEYAPFLFVVPRK